MKNNDITIEAIEEKISKMNTDLNKLSFLEVKLREPGFNFEVKRYLLEKASKLYEERKMFEKAAKCLVNKGAMEISNIQRIETYLKAAELYAKCGKVEDSEMIFVRAMRESGELDKKRIKLARKNIYEHFATELEKKGKKGNAIKFYEKLLKTKLDPLESEIIRKKAIQIYKGLGMFREAKLLEKT